ncbi:MAG TPA: TldD/PmbA family protein [Candidatus Deferrimicrobiaceae bacterium]|nr:TldD/PmbA family protein [Candidatus Deferrimicrobiaceae bacterium]
MPDRLFDLVERELSRLGGGEGELWVRRARVRRYEARDGRIDALSFSDTLSLGVRVFRDGRTGFSYGFGEGEDVVRRTVKEAVFSADASDRDDACGLPEESGYGPAEAGGALEPRLFDPSWERVGEREKADFAGELENRTLAVDPRMKRVRTASLTETVAEDRFRNSRGGNGAQRESWYFASVDSVAEEGSEGSTGYGFGFCRRFSDLSPGPIAEESGRRALRMLGARPLPTGRVAAILENEAAADLLEVLAASFLAPNVKKGRSMFAGRVGTPVASPLVEVVDDPLDPEGTGATLFDGEGVPSRRNVLVRDGTLAGFLADTFWGRKLGTGTTASLRRAAPKVPPAVGTAGLRLTPGNRAMGRILSDLGKGVILTEFLGIHTADPVSGDFSVGASGIRFEGGEEKEPVRGFAVSGNVLLLLRDVIAVGDDFRWFGKTGCPSLAVSGVEIGGS